MMRGIRLVRVEKGVGFTLLLLVASLVVVACSTPPTGGLNEPVSQHDVDVRVTDYALKYIDLEGPDGARQTSNPLLLIDVEVTNHRATPLRYDLRWNATSVSQASSAVLYVDEGTDQLPPPAANSISPVFFGSYRHLDDPVTEATTIAPGETLHDVLFFQRPPQGTNALLLSMPPHIFGSDANLPGYVRFAWQEPEEIAEPEAIQIGDTWTDGRMHVTIQSAEIEYVQLLEGTDARGYSDEPLYKIGILVENQSGRTRTYVHSNSTSVDLPRLIADDGTAISRATFPAGVRPIAQVTRNRSLGDGESIEDVLLFERPAEEHEHLRLLIAGQRFGGEGLLRADLPFEWVEPELPEELRIDDEDDEEEEE